MNRESALMLNEMNCDFYSRNWKTFSNTRGEPWEGWNRLASLLHLEWDFDELECSDKHRRVLDIACGNLRFEKFLESEFPNSELDITGIDSTGYLVNDGKPEPGARFEFVEADIIGKLASEMDRNGAWLPRSTPTGSTAGQEKEQLIRNAAAKTAKRLLQTPSGDEAIYDLSVCFGFMHHVPGKELRRTLLDMMACCTSSGGLVCLTFWMFGEDPRMLDKAYSETESGLELHPEMRQILEPGDFLLGWQSLKTEFRYCHSFNAEEVDELVDSTFCAEKIADFRADGRGSKSNRYIVLRIG